jgi:hypothetical protein
MVFDEDAVLRHPGRLAEQTLGIVGVVQHVDQHHRIERVCGKGDVLPIERSHLDCRLGTHQYIDSGTVEIGPAHQQLAGDEPVAAADIEDVRAARGKLGQMIDEHTNPAAADVRLVQPFDSPHRRLIPRMLTKNPDRMV